MKYSLYVLISIVLSACFSINRPNQKLTREEVIAAIEAFDQGWQSKDKKRVDSVLSPSYMYFTPSGNLFIRDSIIATAGSPDYKLSRVERIISDIRIEGNTAVVNSRWLGKGIYRNEPFDDNQRCSITLVKKGDEINIVAEHCTQIR